MVSCSKCSVSFAGESKEVTVSFSTDHISELYADEVSVEINSAVSMIINFNACS